MQDDATAEGGGAAEQPNLLRMRIARFARVRSAHRALPATAEAIDAVARREAQADEIRIRLSALLRSGVVNEASVTTSGGDPVSLDSAIASMEEDVLRRMDCLDFPALRASIPRAVETHRHEVIALLEVLLGDRSGLPGRLGKVEYLVTILATEEIDGRRHIVHDPASLTPLVASFADVGASRGVVSEAAVELYQAASLDFDDPDPSASLRRIRARKESLGLARLSPELLRAVVTYNARMFNWVVSCADSSRESDEIIGDMLASSVDLAAKGGTALDGTRSADAELVMDTRGEGSAFDSSALAAILAALRQRLQGASLGSGAAERIARALDQSLLDQLERDSIATESRSRRQEVVARTAVVGLILRDRGAVQPELLDLGITQTEITHHWLVELDRAIGSLVSEAVAENGGYQLGQTLFEIKTKYLTAPRSALKGELGRQARDPSQATVAADAISGKLEASRLTREAVATLGMSTTNGSPRGSTDAAVGTGLIDLTARGPARRAVAFAAVLGLALLAFSWIHGEPSEVATLRANELSRTSPYLVSAYRSDQGRGGLLIGRVDPAYARLLPRDRIEALDQMALQFRDQGVREAMLYDSRGGLQIHYADGRIRRPDRDSAPPPESSRSAS